MEGVGDRLGRAEYSQRVRDWIGQAEALDRSLGHVLCYVPFVLNALSQLPQPSSEENEATK